MSRLIFVTHPEVVIDPGVPVPEWPLSEVGRRRMETFAEALANSSLAGSSLAGSSLVGSSVTAVYSSTERKALDGAAIVAGRLGLGPKSDHDLGENDRSSTGYIAPPEFWDVVREFFARPEQSIRGWERAIDAQHRIVTAVSRIAREEPSRGDIVLVAHGAVGCLLAAHLQGVEIGRESRPTHPGGGCYMVLDRSPLGFRGGWHTLEDGLVDQG
jgi:broad specificity phosphatase PhoE